MENTMNTIAINNEAAEAVERKAISLTVQNPEGEELATVEYKRGELAIKDAALPEKLRRESLVYVTSYNDGTSDEPKTKYPKIAKADFDAINPAAWENIRALAGRVGAEAVKYFRFYFKAGKDSGARIDREKARVALNNLTAGICHVAGIEKTGVSDKTVREFLATFNRDAADRSGAIARDNTAAIVNGAARLIYRKLNKLAFSYDVGKATEKILLSDAEAETVTKQSGRAAKAEKPETETSAA